MINGTLHGRVSAERLTINGHGVLKNPAQLPQFRLNLPSLQTMHHHNTSHHP
jgi:hypothetical protein